MIPALAVPAALVQAFRTDDKKATVASATNRLCGHTSEEQDGLWQEMEAGRISPAEALSASTLLRKRLIQITDMAGELKAEDEKANDRATDEEIA